MGEAEEDEWGKKKRRLEEAAVGGKKYIRKNWKCSTKRQSGSIRKHDKKTRYVRATVRMEET